MPFHRCHFGKIGNLGFKQWKKAEASPPPPLWNGCDENRYVIHTNWTFTAVQL